MLTKENFKNTWAKPKTEKRTKPAGDKMVVETIRESETTGAAGEIKMEGMVEETKDEDLVHENVRDTTKSWNPRLWQPKQMPIFAFQRHGIGVVKSKAKDHAYKGEKERNKD